VPAPFRFDREFRFALAPDDLWDVLTRTDEYPAWWPWLRTCAIDGLAPGSSARCEIRAPLPYTLRCVVTVGAVTPGRGLDATVAGDLAGPASLAIAPDGRGSAARLRWSLELRDPVLARLARVGRPAMAWAHDRVVAAGLAQFRERALDHRAPRSTFGPVAPKHQMCPGG
jgi:hypothetical protein